jgi:cold shock CspA family protein
VRGLMLWFNQDKDLGVITTEAGEQLHVDGKDFAGGERPARRSAGAAVTFGVEEDGAGRKATEVSFVPEVAPRRARLRHGRRGTGG